MPRITRGGPVLLRGSRLASPGVLRVNLVTDGGWSAADLDTMADQAGRAWFNFIGCDFPI